MKKIICTLVVFLCGILMGCSEIYDMDTESILRKYDIKIEVQCEKNKLLSKYNLDVFVDDIFEVNVEHGSVGNINLELVEGEHLIKIQKQDDADVYGTITIDVIRDAEYVYNAKCKKSKVEIETLDTTVTIDENEVKEDPLIDETIQTTEEVSVKYLPIEQFFDEETVGRIKAIPNITNIIVSTVDFNDSFKDKPIATLLFTVDKLGKDGISNTENYEKMVDEGGCVEIYKDAATAAERNAYLTGYYLFGLTGGKHKDINNYVIQISQRLSGEEQEKLLYQMSTALFPEDNTNEEGSVATFESTEQVEDETSSQTTEQLGSEAVVNVPKIKTPHSSSVSTYYYEDIVNDMKNAGFTNIEVIAAYDLGTGWLGRSLRLCVDDMTIDDKVSFERDDEFAEDAKVVITYRDFAIMDPNIQFVPYTVSDIFDDVDENALNAVEKYIDKYLEIEGYVGDIDSNGDFVLYPTSSTWELIGIECKIIDIPEHKDVVRTLKKGDYVKVKGKLSLLNQYGGDLNVYKFN